MSLKTINITYFLIVCIYVAAFQIGCQPLPDEKDTALLPTPKDHSPSTPVNQQNPFPPIISTPPSILPSLTEDIQKCVKDNFTLCDPTNNTDYNQCRYRESEQETAADNIITEVYICSHASASSLQLIVNTYIYSTQLKPENALLCDIDVNEKLIGFALCTETFCIDKIKEYLAQGFSCQKK